MLLETDRLVWTGLPLRFRDRTLANYAPVTESQSDALDAAERIVAGKIRNLVLVGPPGVGKTHLAAGVANALAARELDRYHEGLGDRDLGVPHPRLPVMPSWLNVADTIVRMRLDMDLPRDDQRATANVVAAHEFRGLQILDDLGREKVSDWTGEVIYGLVNARYEALLSTIVTSNLTAAELADGPYWPAISRLAEDGALVKIDAPDRRLAR